MNRYYPNQRRLPTFAPRTPYGRGRLRALRGYGAEPNGLPVEEQNSMTDELQPGELPERAKGWWGERSTVEKVAIVGGGLLVVYFLIS